MNTPKSKALETLKNHLGRLNEILSLFNDPEKDAISEYVIFLKVLDRDMGDLFVQRQFRASDRLEHNASEAQDIQEMLTRIISKLENDESGEDLELRSASEPTETIALHCDKCGYGFTYKPEGVADPRFDTVTGYLIQSGECEVIKSAANSEHPTEEEMKDCPLWQEIRQYRT